MRIWIRVTRDEYELPIDFDTNIVALAERWNTTRNAIASAICHGRGYWRKVEIDE